MKKLLLLFSIVLLFITCKKDKKTSIDATGTWTLYSLDTDAPPYPSHNNADQHPCMAKNVLTFNKNQTFISNYIGIDTCFVASGPIVTSPPLKSWIGIPGQTQISGSWSQNGNTIYWGPSRGTISTSYGKTLLTIHTSITYSGVTYDIKTVDVKQ